MGADARFCAICQTAVEAEHAATNCPECAAPYHTECWDENGGCGVYGCAQVPKTEHRASLEIPVSYWGQEHKNCPVCQSQIMAAAVRCRVCGTSFGSARPQDTNEFAEQAARSARAPALKNRVGWMFALCVVPFTSPFATIAGAIWYRMRRREIAALPALYSALSKIALIVGFGKILIGLIVMIAMSLR